MTAPAATDRALRGIVLANAVTLVLAVIQQWSVLQLMWPFWMQSVIIGWYSRQRILALREFSTEGLTINDRAVDPTPETQRRVANFFALHYGGFHAAYLFFLWMFSTTADPAGFVSVSNESSGTTSQVYVGHVHPLDVVAYLALAFGFWRSHRASHREHVRADLAGRPNLGTLMFMPYARIVPMHLTLIAGVPLGGGAVWLFVLLKTAADVVMHKVEHRVLGRNHSGVARSGSRTSGPVSR
ncbi:MAG: DUF6498-containing protein [Pseudomonadales bacterium]